MLSFNKKILIQLFNGYGNDKPNTISLSYTQRQG